MAHATRGTKRKYGLPLLLLATVWATALLSGCTAEGSNGGDPSGTIVTLLALLVLLGLIFFFLSRSGRGTQQRAMMMGRSKARLATGKVSSVTFADVAGIDEAKEDLKEIVDFIKDRWKFARIGASIPKGVLLVGPPGTGKTLLARAVAGEAGVPFYSVSGSEFVEIFVGVGASRVRDLFEQAKKNTPSIIFIDEIDAIGRSRSAGITGSHEEREQTLNQILTEMDGFEPNTGIMVLAATNRPDILDPALLRPGRFDRRVTLDLPDTNGRVAILKVHARGKAMDPTVDLEAVARQTHGFSGADLANLVNEAAILAVRRGKESIGMVELDDSVDRVIGGPERKSIRINIKDRETTAYHEVGHALVAHTLSHVDPVHKISIVARGTMGGYTRLLSEERYFITMSQFKDTLATLLAGHTAEEMMLHEVSTGPHSDIRQATQLALKMITDYGMSKDLGLRTFGVDEPAAYAGMVSPYGRNYSEQTAQQIDKEVLRIMEEARGVARSILEQNKPRLVHIARRLLEKETLQGEQLHAAFNEPLEPADYAAFAHTV